ncbi:MAG: hypothetical protein AAFQ36_08815 [Pseudomonadota bacterium]
MKIALAASVALIALSACSPFRSGSESVVSASQVNRASTVERCRVLEVREITIRDDDATGAGTVVGALAGGLIGNAAGSTVGGGVGNDLAQNLGAIGGVVGGAALGEQLDQSRAERTGVEYSVIKASGEELIIRQELFPSDRISQPGETCRISTNTANGKITILPAQQLPGSIAAPTRTVIR